MIVLKEIMTANITETIETIIVLIPMIDIEVKNVTEVVKIAPIKIITGQILAKDSQIAQKVHTNPALNITIINKEDIYPQHLIDYHKEATSTTDIIQDQHTDHALNHKECTSKMSLSIQIPI